MRSQIFKPLGRDKLYSCAHHIVAFQGFLIRIIKENGLAMANFKSGFLDNVKDYFYVTQSDKTIQTQKKLLD